MSWNSLYKLGWSQSHRFSCLCLLRARIKGMLHREMKGRVLEEHNSWVALLLHLFSKHSGTTSCASGTVAGIRALGWPRSVPPLPLGFMVQYREQKTQTVKKGKSIPKKGPHPSQEGKALGDILYGRGNSSIREGDITAGGGKQAGVAQCCRWTSGGCAHTISSALVLPEGHSPPHGWSTRQTIKSHSSSSRFSVSSCRGSGSI